MKVLFSITDFMPSEAKCVSILKKIRWGKGVYCPHCSSRYIVKIGPYQRNKYMHRYRCKECNRSFTDKTGTIFDCSKLPLNEWFYIARELQRNISINQITKDLGRKYDNVHRASRIIMDSVFMKRLISLNAEDIEIDEMYQSAGAKGTKQTGREPRKRGLKLRGRGNYDKDKPPIVAVVERGGKAVMEVFHNLNKKNLDAFLYLITGRFVHTDDFRIYNHLDDGQGIIHLSVNHSKREYAQCYKHTNTVEGLYADLRTWLRRYKGVRKENLYRFVSLFQFNYNHRLLQPLEMLTGLIYTLIRR